MLSREIHLTNNFGWLLQPLSLFLDAPSLQAYIRDRTWCPEYISPRNERIVFHDNLGFEPSDEQNLMIVKDFVTRRKAMPHLKDQLHAIWFLLETPYAVCRLLNGGAESFLRHREEILGQIPFVVVLTKVDQLDIQLELDPPVNEDVGQYKSRFLNKHCPGPLHKAAGSDVTHVTVSVQDGYSESLFNLIKVTDESIAKYYVDGAPRLAACIAPRFRIKERIELSITVAKKRYQSMFLKSTTFRRYTLQECLQTIREDVIAVWNLNDPHQYLMDVNIIEALLRTDNLGDTSGVPAYVSLVSSINSSLGLLKALSGSGDIILSIVGAAIQRRRVMAKDAKTLIAYIVDLICVMQVIFLLTSGGRVIVAANTASLALRVYEQPRRIVHLSVDAFDGKLGSDRIMNKTEELIWRFSIADHEVEELMRSINQVLPPGSL